MNYYLRQRLERRSKQKNQITETQQKPNLNNQNNISNTKMSKKNQISMSLDTILRALPNFDGNNYSSIDQFIDQYDELIKEADITDKVKLILLKSKFSGNARDIVYSSQELIDAANYNEFKTAVVKSFSKPQLLTQSQSKFMDLQQKPDQTIDDFVRVFNNAACKYLKDSGHAQDEGAQKFLSTIKLTRFIDSVRSDIGFQIKIADPKTFEEAIEIARKVESALNTSKESINNIRNSKENTQTEKKDETHTIQELLLHKANKQEEEMTKMREAINNINIQKQNTIDKDKNFNKFCHICKVNNHMTDYCWFNSKNLRPNNTAVGKPQMYKTYNHAENTQTQAIDTNRMFSQVPNMQQNILPQQTLNQNYAQPQVPQPNAFIPQPSQQINYPMYANNNTHQQNFMPYNEPQNFQQLRGYRQNFDNSTYFNPQNQNSYRQQNINRGFQSNRRRMFRNRTFTQQRYRIPQQRFAFQGNEAGGLQRNIM